MFDLLAIAPDTINQIADTTEVFSEPMRALLDSISAKTGQTAQNTARDSVDWQIIQITKRDYYIAIGAIVIALISLVVDIFTTIYQHISSSNSILISAKYTLPVQESLAIDMMKTLYWNAMIILVLKHRLKHINFSSYPSEYHMRACNIKNHLELEALCVKIPELLSRYNSVCEQFDRFNSKCDVVTEHLKSKTLSNEIKESDMQSLILSLELISQNILSLLKKLDKNKDYNLMLWNRIKDMHIPYAHYEEPTFPNDIDIDWHKEFGRFMHILSSNASEEEIIKMLKRTFSMHFYAPYISMIKID